MKVLLLVPALSSVDGQNRLEELEKLGVECKVAGFQRRYYPGKEWGKEVISLGYVEHVNYIKRLTTLLKAVPEIRRQSNEVSYLLTLSFDLLLISWISLIGKSKKPGIIHDVSDIRSAFIGSHLAAKLLRCVERFLLRRVRVVIVTSWAYVTEYFQKIQKLHDVPFHLIENKLNPGSAPKPSQKAQRLSKPKETFTIGYFGLIRCERSLQVLMEAASRLNGRIQVIIRGVFLGTESYQEKIENHPYITYEGSYVAPDDLRSIHDEVDFSWLVHAHSNENTKWSRIFRFYHAAHYKCPMIAQEGSQDGIVVDQLGIGFNVDIFNFENVEEALKKISYRDLMKWQNSLDSLPPEISLISDEYKKLIELIK